MQIVKKSQTVKVAPSSSTSILEYPMDDPNLSGAIAEINGRYPETGFAKNEVSTELVYVLEGRGKVITPDEEQNLEEGDTILLLNGELFAWEGHFRIFEATAPKFNPDQHKLTI